MIGIYKITNPKGKIYIGQSVNIEKRWMFYKKLHCKEQTKLYNSFLKYGVDKHIFEIVTCCEYEKLNELEKYYVDLFQTFNNINGLNIRDGGGSKGRLSDETKIKISIGNKGKKHSVETILKMIEDRKNISNLTRKKMSESAKKAMSDERKNENRISSTGRRHSEQTKQFLRDLKLNRVVSDTTKLKIKESHQKLIINTETGIFYFGISEAALSHNINKYTLQKQLIGKVKKNSTNLIYV